MIRELLRIYLMDIIFTIASLYILFNKWEDDNVSARTVKIVTKLVAVLHILNYFLSRNTQMEIINY